MNTSQQPLARQIRRRLAERKPLTASGLGRAIGRRAGYVTDLINGKSKNPSVFDVAKIADFFSCTVDELLERGTAEGPVPLSNIPVIGAVEAGLWRRTWLWDETSQYHIAVPEDDRWPKVRRYGLLMVGTSMNTVYPDGTILVVADFEDLKRQPQDFDRVVYRRRDTAGLTELVAAVFKTDDKGHRWLWPSSDDPEHQQPILAGEKPGLAEAATSYRAAAAPTRRSPIGEPGAPEVFARVIASYQPV